MKKIDKPPSHLSREAKALWRQILAEWELEPHQIAILRAALEALDRSQEARATIKKLGTTFTDRFGQPHARPEVKIELENRTAFYRGLRELNLTDPGPESRPPEIPRRYRET